MGYHRAGFDVVGVDIDDQPAYPFRFVRADALAPPFDLAGFDAIHASPPCQRWSKAVKKANRDRFPDLLPPLRALLRASSRPYVIENGPRAPLVNPVQLCGSAFGMPIQRHRRFESNVMILSPGCAHGAYPRVYPPAWNRTTPLRVLSISGGYTRSSGDVPESEYAAAMEVGWMTRRHDISEAIPPAYTEHIGRHLLGMMT
jgi:DNA (cytosine-5)-methyltransferase 1